MDEIRFNKPIAQEPDLKAGHQKEEKKGKKFVGTLIKKMKIIFFVLILIVAVVFVFSNISYLKSILWEERDLYSAIFLTNGQVYFGKIIKNNKEEIMLQNVYYVQVNGEETAGTQAANLNQARFNIVKLGDEIHGPTDELFINKEQVIFYEHLRKDSKIVEFIEKNN